MNLLKTSKIIDFWGAQKFLISDIPNYRAYQHNELTLNRNQLMEVKFKLLKW